MRKQGRFAAIVALSGLMLASTSFATITDDINPLGQLVDVHLVNPDSQGYKGNVSVSVQLAGGTDVKVVPFTISAGGQMTITATFPGEVLSVLSVTIEERPLTL